MEPRYYSTTEAAKVLGISSQRITQLIRSGVLEAKMAGGRWLVDAAAVERRGTTSPGRGGRPRVGEGHDDITFTLMNREHEICETVYNRRRREFVSMGGFIDRERAPLGIFGRRGISDIVSLESWWRGRGIPGTRVGLQRILYAAEVDVPDELVMRNLGLSLSDQYWIRPKGSDILWRNINFFNNSIERVSQITAPLTPINTPRGAHPDNTSDGNLSKWWVTHRERRVLMKGGGVNNQEPFNEVVATALYRRVLLDGEYVSYTLANKDDETLCACNESLTDEEEPNTAAQRMP